MAFVTLVRPPMVVVRLIQSRSTCPPIGVAYLASSLQKAGHKVDVIDAVAESIFQILPFDGGPEYGRRNFFHGLTLDETVDRINPRSDYIGVSCMFSIEWVLVRELIIKIRKRFPNKPIIVGGEHVTATAEWIFKTRPEIDYIVLGEGEMPLVNLVNALETGKPPSEVAAVLSRENPKKPERTGSVDRYLFDLRIRDVDDLPEPAWDLLPLENYLDNGFGYGTDRGRNMPMLATRGCPYQCTFCSSPQMWSTRWVARKPEKVLDEMEFYLNKYNAENFSFYDLTAIVKREWIIEFCNLVLQRGLKFTWQLPSGTRSEAIDGEVASLLYATGCRNMNYAPESGSPRTLQRIKKKVDLKAMKKSMRDCGKHRLVVKSNTILGFPGETHKDIWLTLKWLAEIAGLGVHEATLTQYIPYPGTELFDSLVAQGKIQNVFSDGYFSSLATKGNIFENKSWSEHISHKAITRYITYGNLIFQLVSFALRPWRVTRAVWNVLRNKPEESRLEATLRTLFSGRIFKNIFSSERKTPYLASRTLAMKGQSVPAPHTDTEPRQVA